jgi:hypothetical protein
VKLLASAHLIANFRVSRQNAGAHRAINKAQSAAVRASIGVPVSSISKARLRPIARLTATIGVVQKSPIFTPGVAKEASPEAIAMSQVATS